MTEELINKIATINCNDSERKEVYTALKKQIPKKVVKECGTIICPVCKESVISIGGRESRYCDECGQLIEL